MPRFRTGIVTAVTSERKGLQRVEVDGQPTTLTGVDHRCGHRCQDEGAGHRQGRDGHRHSVPGQQLPKDL